MSNQKISQLRRLSPSEVSGSDLIPLVDVTEITSPTGETKAITVDNLTQYIASGGFLEICTPLHGYQTANGLAFDQFVAPDTDLNLRCYGEFPEVGTQFSLMVRAFIPSSMYIDSPVYRAIFGIGESQETLTSGSISAYIGVENYDLIGYTYDGITAEKISITNFIYDYEDKVFEAVLTRNSSGISKLYLNSTLIGTSSAAATTISSSYVVMGNGHPTAFNIDCTIYEAHIFNTALTSDKVKSMFYGGVKNSDTTLIASYTSPNLNPGPTQWLDSKGTNHILLPVTGAVATNPDKEFSLRLKSDGTSGFLGNGTERDILPDNYVLTDAFVYSTGSPLLSIGSTSSVAPLGASGIHSWNNNRVPLTNAIYSRNNLQLLELGVAHTDKSIYVFYSASAAPCTFSFEGYISDYGPLTYSPPAPVIISSLYETATNSIAYSYQILATNYPVIYSSSNLPTGLSLNNLTGLISGTPVATAGLYYVGLFAANYDATGSAIMTMSLAPAPTTTTTSVPVTTTTAAVTTTTAAGTTTTAAGTTTTAAGTTTTAAGTTTTAAGTTTTAAVTTTTTLAPLQFTQVIGTGATNCGQANNGLIVGLQTDALTITNVNVSFGYTATVEDPINIILSWSGGTQTFTSGTNYSANAQGLNGSATITVWKNYNVLSSVVVTVDRVSGGYFNNASSRCLASPLNAVNVQANGRIGGTYKYRSGNASSGVEINTGTGTSTNLTVTTGSPGSIFIAFNEVLDNVYGPALQTPSLITATVGCSAPPTPTTTTAAGTTTTAAGTTTTAAGTTTTEAVTTTTEAVTTTTEAVTTTTAAGTTTTEAVTTTTEAVTTTTEAVTTTTAAGTTTTAAGTTTTAIPCYTNTWYYTQTDNYDNTDPENPVYISTTYDINTGTYTRCDGNPESFVVNITLDHPNDPAYVSHSACIQGVGSPVCYG